MRFFTATAHRRDVDNLLKVVLDAATGIVWEDDSQVAEAHIWIERVLSGARTEVDIYETGPTNHWLASRSNVVCVRVDQDVLDAVDREAAREGLTRSDWLRERITRLVED